MIPALHSGMKLPFFEEGGTPVTDFEAFNPVVAVVNALLNLKVHRSPAAADSSRSVIPNGNAIFSSLNVVIELKD